MNPYEELVKATSIKLREWIDAGEIDEGVWIQNEILSFLLSSHLARVERWIEEVEKMVITKENAEELAHTPLCKSNPDKGNKHFFCSITNADYSRNQALSDLLFLLTAEREQIKKLLK